MAKNVWTASCDWIETPCYRQVEVPTPEYGQSDKRSKALENSPPGTKASGAARRVAHVALIVREHRAH